MAGMPTPPPPLAGLPFLLPPCCVAESPAPGPAPAPAARDAQPVYQTRPATPHRIGQFYRGREIAQVMGHQAAGWLERAEREQEEQPQKLMHLMDLRPSDVVADIGAGTGYFSFRIAVKVPDGKVLAVDIQPEMLELLTRAAQGP